LKYAHIKPSGPGQERAPSLTTSPLSKNPPAKHTSPPREQGSSSLKIAWPSWDSYQQEYWAHLSAPLPRRIRHYLPETLFTLRQLVGQRPIFQCFLFISHKVKSFSPVSAEHRYMKPVVTLLMSGDRVFRLPTTSSCRQERYRLLGIAALEPRYSFTEHVPYHISC
jgi:hypothetical protein